MGMVGDDLAGGLAEMGDLAFETETLGLLWDGIEIEAVLVGEMIEDVHFCDGLLAPLFIPIDQIHPARHTLRDILGLHRLPQHRHKIVRILFTPLRQHHIINPLLILRHPKIIIIHIDEQLREHIEVRNKLPHITRRSCRVMPRILIVGEDAIRHIEFTALEGHSAIGVGFEAD